ncbi:MAG: hypothetical protein PQJ61_06805 [Spirochaetales bacterium]|uniref:Uncharacterized protein n=1 Tax=Candidatus Thalassospirochaeta sargassi TaxID=3119039 RepID=A0AAJ1MJE2_9SPIO|nr:hypothetical protein [Spirochaetales bacterium]
MNDINGLHIAVLIISGLIVLLILYYLLRNKPEQNASGRRKYDSKPAEPPTKPCPLCRAALKPGETVHSVLYPGKPDSLMEIYGCPYCEPGKSSGTVRNKRICPVCKKELSDNGLVIARVFEKPGKKHVHVLGCTDCYSGRTNVKRK